MFIGANRGLSIGNLTLVRGSGVPAKGTGTISAVADAVISVGQTKSLLPQLLTSPRVPVFVELQFDVGVGVRTARGQDGRE